ncbi:MAG TPA: ribbon-helix-helix protein, CopG family [Acidimicrobiales bacterium]|nr:ribbon-helix-helix protein, CopG family [Acidimicrobiales bacterium]
MDLNVKNLDPEVAARLAEQAAAEGLSQQEWIRQVLRRTAARLSPAELVAQRATLTPMSDDDFAALRLQAAGRRRAAAERLVAPGRGR